jgi:hypothetical protein
LPIRAGDRIDALALLERADLQHPRAQSEIAEMASALSRTRAIREQPVDC